MLKIHPKNHQRNYKVNDLLYIHNFYVEIPKHYYTLTFQYSNLEINCLMKMLSEYCKTLVDIYIFHVHFAVNSFS